MAQVIGKMRVGHGSIPCGTTVDIIESYTDNKGKHWIVTVPKTSLQETVPIGIVKIIKTIREFRDVKSRLHTG